MWKRLDILKLELKFVRIQGFGRQRDVCLLDNLVCLDYREERSNTQLMHTFYLFDIKNYSITFKTNVL